MFRYTLVLSLASLAAFISSCGSSSDGRSVFCDTACFGDSLVVTGSHRLKPYVVISASHCEADTIAWSYEGMGVNRKMGISDLLNNEVTLNRNYIKIVMNDTAAALVMFNDCHTGRGYQLLLPFNDRDNLGRRSSGINNLDPRFHVDESMVAYTDRGNLFVEEISTGKKATVTFGKALPIDYDAIHDHIDSVHVTPSRVWVRVKIDDNWEELDKKITLE